MQNNPFDTVVQKARKKRMLRRGLAALCAVVMLLTYNAIKFEADTLERVAVCAAHRAGPSGSAALGAARRPGALGRTAAGVRLVEIVPSEDIGGVFGWQGVFDVSPDTATHLIELGRKDAREKLREAGLAD